MRVEVGTFSMASFTRSLLIRPFCARFVIRASFVAPELRQAMVMERALEGLELLREQKRLGRKGRVESVRRNNMRRSLEWTDSGAVVECVLTGSFDYIEISQ